MQTAIKLLADGMMVPIVLVAAYALLWKVPRTVKYDMYTRVFMAGITSYVLAKFIGTLWQPEKMRPFEQMGIDPGAAYLNNPGFPSDHALFAAFLVFAVWFATKNKPLTIIVGVMTLLVAVGRVLAYVHTPLDVAGGIAIAALGTVWYYAHAKKQPKSIVAKNAKK